MRHRQKPGVIQKITPPVLPQIFLRKRPFRLLDAALNHPVVWISAPAGAGKTTLVASYLDARKLPRLWYQIDQGDGDVASFFYYMGLAAKKAAPHKRSPMPLLTPEYLQGLPTFTLRYFEELYGRLLQRTPGFDRFIIVFDNYQEAHAESMLHEIICHGLGVIPEGINAIIISRGDAPPPFAALRAGSRMNFLGWDEIRLDMQETKEFVEIRMASASRLLSGGNKPPLCPSFPGNKAGINRENKGRRGISDETIRRLHERTEGWAAGLALMAEGIKTLNLDELMLRNATHAAIFDYFTTELFHNFDKETRNFLMKTAFLPRVTAPMAEKLTGLSRSDRILSELNRNNYFTQKYSHTEPVYQYHQIFREFLLSRALNTFLPEEIHEVRKATACILEESGQVEDAAGLFLEAGDWTNAIQLILKQAQNFIAQGRNATLEVWLRKIPEKMREDTPWLLYWLGVCRMPFDPKETLSLFERALIRFHAAGDAMGSFLSWTSAMDTWLGFPVDPRVYDKWLPLAHEILARHVFPSEDVEAHFLCNVLMVHAFRQPQHAGMWNLEERAHALFLRQHDVNARLRIAAYLSLYYYWRGENYKANQIITFLRELGIHKKSPPFFILSYYVSEIYCLMFNGQIEPCLRTLSDTLRTAESSGIHIFDCQLFSQGAAAGMMAGDLEAAREFLQKMVQAASRTNIFDVSYYHYLCSWRALLQGDLPQAGLHIERALELILQCAVPFSAALCYLQKAQVCYEGGDEREAMQCITGARRIGETMGSYILEYLCLLAEAQFALDGGRLGEAERTQQEHPGKGNSPQRHRGAEEMVEGGMANPLRRAMAIGREKGYMYLYGWRPDVMARLCQRALEDGIEVEYVRRVIRTCRLSPESPEEMCENWPWLLKIFTLGQFAVLKDGTPVRSSGKAQEKPLRMLKSLIAFGGRDVAEEHVCDQLWPESDGDLSHVSFKTTLHRLRRLLGHEKAIRLQDGQLSLDPHYCWVDVWAFQRLCDKSEEIFENTGGTIIKEESAGNASSGNPLFPHDAGIRLAEKAIGMYRGNFLSSDIQPWTISMRERLKSKFIRIAARSGKYLEQTGQWEKAVAHYHKALEADGLAEELYGHLMQCYCKLGRKAEAGKVYQRCRAELSAALGILPSARTEEIYRELMA